MKRKLAALLLALILTLALPVAFAADSRIESVEYEGFGILKIEFTQDCDWYASSTITLTDANGADVPFVFIGGEAKECYLRAESIANGAPYTLDFALEGTEQSVALCADTAAEFRLDANGEVKERARDEKCDLCGNRGHDDDFCPERVDAENLPSDPDALAKLFDIDRCDRCGGMGHDDDHCPGK